MACQIAKRTLNHFCQRWHRYVLVLKNALFCAQNVKKRKIRNDRNGKRGESQISRQWVYSPPFPGTEKARGRCFFASRNKMRFFAPDILFARKGAFFGLETLIPLLLKGMIFCTSDFSLLSNWTYSLSLSWKFFLQDFFPPSEIYFPKCIFFSPVQCQGEKERSGFCTLCEM